MHRRPAWLSIAILAFLTAAVYFRPAVVHAGLFGSDYRELHARHIAFARAALFGPAHFLPAWYPRELLGAPFAANVQSFPWIPTRLLLLLLDPKFAYAAAVLLAALLAALFTYLFCKHVGLSELGSISAGWTFACAGYFASRVMAGHLPLLEAYPMLPLLLWLADRAVDPDRARSRTLDLSFLALAAACTALAGHPQLPAYALGAAFLYLLVRGRGRSLLFAASAFTLGIAATLFAWWPMLLLIRRSTRMLDLAPPANDVAFQYGRLLGLLRPGIDGWPDMLQRPDLFSGYPNDAYFWDTASYLGWLPLIAMAFLLVRALVIRRLPAPPFVYLTALGIAAFLLSLPVAQPLHGLIPGTVFRSPARLFYLCTFCLAVALGSSVSAVQRNRFLPARLTYGILAVCLCVHAIDLGAFARMFIRPAQPDDFPPQFAKIIDRELDHGRIAADDPAFHERYDDAGIFDSILLASPYRALLRLARLPPDWNEQRLDASAFPIPALQAAGVRFVITSEERTDLTCVLAAQEQNLYRVPNPAPRAGFYDPRLRPDVPVNYVRPSSDRIQLSAHAAGPGLINVLESFDPGWSATMDGVPAPVLLTNGFTIGIPVAPGQHSIQFTYRTPGRRTGCLFSLTSLVLLLALLRIESQKKNPA